MGVSRKLNGTPLPTACALDGIKAWNATRAPPIRTVSLLCDMVLLLVHGGSDDGPFRVVAAARPGTTSGLARIRQAAARWSKPRARRHRRTPRLARRPS